MAVNEWEANFFEWKRLVRPNKILPKVFHVFNLKFGTQLVYNYGFAFHTEHRVLENIYFIKKHEIVFLCIFLNNKLKLL